MKLLSWSLLMDEVLLFFDCLIFHLNLVCIVAQTDEQSRLLVPVLYRDEVFLRRISKLIIMIANLSVLISLKVDKRYRLDYACKIYF